MRKLYHFGYRYFDIIERNDNKFYWNFQELTDDVIFNNINEIYIYGTTSGEKFMNEFMMRMDVNLLLQCLNSINCRYKYLNPMSMIGHIIDKCIDNGNMVNEIDYNADDIFVYKLISKEYEKYFIITISGDEYYSCCNEPHEGGYSFLGIYEKKSDIEKVVNDIISTNTIL